VLAAVAVAAKPTASVGISTGCSTVAAQYQWSGFAAARRAAVTITDQDLGSIQALTTTAGPSGQLTGIRGGLIGAPLFRSRRSAERQRQGDPPIGKVKWDGDVRGADPRLY
jgi:hypothetical protein